MIWQNLEETYPFKIYIGEKWGKHDGGRFINNFQGQEEEHSFNHVEREISKILNHTLGRSIWKNLDEDRLEWGEKVGRPASNYL